MGTNIYEDWLDAVEKLKDAQEWELRIRNSICELHLEDVLEGSKTETFEDLKITATARLNRTVDRVVLDSIWEDLTPEEQAAINFKPDLRIGLYKPIEASGGLLLEAVTVKPGQPSLKIVRIEDV